MVLPDVNQSGGFYPIAGNMQVARFRAGNGATISVTGHAALRVTDEFRIDGAVLDIQANSSLTLYVANAIRIEGRGTKLNATLKDPSKFVIHSDAAAVEHIIGDNVEAYALIDAPNASLTLDGTSQLFGAFMGNALVVRNGAQLHLDRNPAVAAANPRMAWCKSKLTVYVNNKVLIQKSARINVDTADPLNVSIYHHGPMSMEVKESAIVYAQAFVPEMLMYIGGSAQWTGRIRARDFTVAQNAVVTVDGSGGVANPGVVVEETIELRDYAEIKPTGGPALLASHGACDTTIRIRDTAKFNGSAYTGPGGNANDEVRVSSGATFTGLKRALIVPADISASPQPPVTVSVSDRYVASSTLTLPEGDVYYRSFKAQGGAEVRVTGTTRLILTGSFEFKENARLVLSPGAQLTVYCPKDVTISGSARLNVQCNNLGGNPSRFTLNCSPPRRERWRR